MKTAIHTREDQICPAVRKRNPDLWETDSRVCRCSHCHRMIEFESHKVGEAVSCPACNQDTKLYAGGWPAKGRDIPISLTRPTRHFVSSMESDTTLCCGKKLDDLPQSEYVTDERESVTCKSVVHLLRDGLATTVCCGRAFGELPTTDRATMDSALCTCRATPKPAPQAEEPLIDRNTFPDRTIIAPEFTRPRRKANPLWPVLVILLTIFLLALLVYIFTTVATELRP